MTNEDLKAVTDEIAFYREGQEVLRIHADGTFIAPGTLEPGEAYEQFMQMLMRVLPGTDEAD